MTDQRSDGNEDEVTDGAVWSASDDTVTVERGRVIARRPGLATVSATKSSSDRALSASVQISVETPGTAPQVAYAIEGVVRDLTNAGLAGVDVAISDERGHARAAITREPEGSFTFPPVPAGQYHLKASKAAYRPFEAAVSVPNERSITVALLKEPAER